jgi:hypothetical protein
MRRLPVYAFGLLAAATIGAFFLIAHLKAATPLIYGHPKPVPRAFDPVSGRSSSCKSSKGTTLDYRETQLTLQVSRADLVGVFIVSVAHAGGAPVATVSSGTPLKTNQFFTFSWNGRLDTGRIAPDGPYLFRIALLRQGRTIQTSWAPVQVVTHAPHPRIVSVTVVGGSGASGSSGSGRKSAGAAVLSPPHGSVRIDFTAGAGRGLTPRRVWINIYRTDVAGKPKLVTRLKPKRTARSAIWNGKIGGQPAPAGTYLAGITAQNPACDQASWPIVLPPGPGTTPHAGVSVRYLSVTPPLTPMVSGSRASVAVDSPDASYTWKLRRSGTAKVLAHGAGAAGATHIEVRMPRHQAGLYTLVVRSGAHSAAVPLVASQAGRAASMARVLVVLPMLSWIGNTPVDDTGDGVPDTLRGGVGVTLSRPLVDGPPASLGDDAELLNYLNGRHDSYQLTTDVALAEGTGPSLVDRWGVLLGDGEDFLPTSSLSRGGKSLLPGFVKGGGRVATLGTGALQGTSQISGYPADPRAAAPVVTKTDMFGAQRGPLTPTRGDLITELTDDLSVFGGAPAFTGVSEYQPIEPPAGVPVSAAGIANGSPAIIAFRSGSGVVAEVGLPNFGASLKHDVDSQELLDRLWQLLAKQR